MIRKLAALALATAVLAAGCGGGDDDTATATSTAPTTAKPAAATSAPTTAAPTTAAPTTAATPAKAAAAADDVLAVADTSLGSVLVDDHGLTLYMFTKDSQGGDSTCYDQCEAKWPVLEGTLTAGSGVDGSLIGTVARTNGTTQATYNGWPLYYFAPDTAAGEVKGQGVGEVWYVLDANGEPVMTAAPAAGAPTTTAAAPRY